MMNKKFKLTIVLVSIICALLLAGWWFIFNAIKARNDYLGVLRGNLAIASQRSERIRLIERTLRDIDEKNQKISFVFAGEKELVGVIRELENLSSRVGASFEMKGITFPAVKINPVFQFRVTGDFSSVFSYFMLFEEISYETKIIEAELKKSDVKDQKGIWQANFQFELLSYLPS